MKKTAIVIASHHKDFAFLDEWQLEFSQPNIELLICYDRDDKPPALPAWAKGAVYNRAFIKKELGENAWIIPFQTSAIKSFGFYKAYQLGFDYIITLDTDCFPDQTEFIAKHHQALEQPVTLDWVTTVETGYTLYPRGFPYSIRDKAEVVLNHGLWSNIPDLDAPTQLMYPDLRLEKALHTKVVPKNNFFPMCGMNLAFKTKIAPLMYFGLQGPNWPYDRFDDIWCGLFAKKILDEMSLAVTSGKPSIEHRKQSDVFVNLRKETPGIIMHEVLWPVVSQMQFDKKTGNLTDYYASLIEQLPGWDDYLIKLKQAMTIWLSLFTEKL